MNTIKAQPSVSQRGFNAKRQRGMVTLLVAALSLALVSAMAVYTANVSMTDIRISANEARRGEAMAAAEAGLAQAFDYHKRRPVSVNTPTPAVGTSVAEYWGNQATDLLTTPTTLSNGSTVNWERMLRCTSGLVVPPAGDDDAGAICNGAGTYYVIRTQGLSADGSSSAEVQLQVAYGSYLGGPPPDTPVVAAGSVGTGGNFNVVANPNGGGDGVPVSLWTSGTVTPSGSSATCQAQYFSGTACSGSLLSSGTTELDIVDDDPLCNPDCLTAGHTGNFPNDVFEYLFGTSALNYADVRAMATVLADCSSLNEYSVGLYWIEGGGTCGISANSTVGAAADDAATDDAEGPIILVLDQTSLQMNGGASINGIVFAFDKPTSTPYAAGEAQETQGLGGTLQLNGNAVVNGALIANYSLGTALNGTFSVNYDSAVLAQFAGAGSGGGGVGTGPLTKIVGSWRDF